MENDNVMDEFDRIHHFVSTFVMLGLVFLGTYSLASYHKKAISIDGKKYLFQERYDTYQMGKLIDVNKDGVPDKFMVHGGNRFHPYPRYREPTQEEKKLFLEVYQKSPYYN